MPCFHLNESVYHSFNCNIMDGVSFEGNTDQFYGKVENGKSLSLNPYDFQMSKLFGMTCDGLDVIANSMSIPKDMKVGDWLCFSGMGSYTNGPKSNFNGMSSTETVDYWSAKLEE